MKITIAHSWSTNMGDAAILCATIKMLKRIDPDFEITVLASDPEFTKEKCPDLDAKLMIWPWPVSRKRGLSYWIKAPFILASHFFSVLLYRLTKMRIFPFKEFAFPLSSFFDCDVLISSGGGFINPRFYFFISLSELAFAKILGKKSIIMPQTIGPFYPLMDKIAGAMINLADAVILREEKSAEMLMRMGVKNTYVTTDIAFAGDKEVSGKRKNRIIICPKETGKDSYDEYIEKLVGRIICETDCEVVFLPTEKADIEFQKELATGIPVKVIDSIEAPEKISEIVSESEFIISNRMHPIIFGCGTPFFAISDDHKFEGVLDKLCKGCCMDISGIEKDETIDLIMEKIRNREKLRKVVTGNFQKARMRAMETEGILRERFESWGENVRDN